MDAEQQLTIPNRLEVGAAYRVVAPLLVTAAWTWDRWSVYDADVFVGDNGATIRVPRDYANGYTFRGGAEYDVAKTFQVRVGLQRDVSGLNKRFYSPTLPDASSWAGSLGATYKFGRGVSADAAVFYAIMDQVKAEDPNSATPGTGLEPTYDPVNGVFIPQPEGTFRGTYDISALVFAVSVTWTPGAK